MDSYESLLEMKRIAPEWDKLKLLKFEKNLYVEHPDVASRPVSDVEAWKEQQDIYTEGFEVANPVMSFAESQLPKYVLDVCAQQGFTEPTPVQSQVWPCVLSGKNVLVVAKTGSGKTLAYLLPALPHIMSQPLLEKGEGPIVLVMCPTRELALQVEQAAEQYLPECRLRGCSVYGGVPKAEQAARLARGVELVVATPGRLLDLIDSGATNLMRVTFVVLDEADRMLSLGFGQFVSKIEALIRPDRQAMLLSATLPRDVESLAHKYLRSSGGAAADLQRVTIKIGTSGGELAACSTVAQRIVVTTEDEKKGLLLEELRKLQRYEQCLVFCKTRARVDEMAAFLANTFGSARVRGMHGEYNQAVRSATLEGFRTKQIQILVSTGLMGRGVDIPCITHVLSLDFPPTVEEYVHRVGRTGRAGSTGVAISFITHEHYSLVEGLIAYLEDSQQTVPAELEAMLPGGRKRKADSQDAGAKRQRPAPTSFEGTVPDTSGLNAPVLKNAIRRSGRALQTVSDPPPPASTTGARLTYYSTKPSHVLLLRNVAAPGKVDPDLKEDIWQESDRLGGGAVLDVVVYEHKRWGLSGNLPEEEAVRIFVKFRTAEAALAVYKVMHGRQFDGRTIVAVFADPVDFDNNSFAPVDGEPPMASTLLLRNMLNEEELDDDFVPDIVSEMSAFGQVSSCVVHVVSPEHQNVPKEERIRVFVKFGSYVGAIQALISVDGRSYSNREIAAHLYDDMRWALDDLAPNDKAEPPLPLRCLISAQGL